jgi:cytochrome b6-f complex iron-sulfur subunit
MPTCTGTQGVIGPSAEAVGLNQAVAVQGMSNLFVCRDSNGFMAVNITCTHAGCTLGFKADRNIWECPCHQSQFTLTGTLIGGAAKRNLTRYAVCRASDGLTRIDTSKIIP